MVSTRDPETLRDEPGVDFREQEQVVDEEAFEQAAEGAENQSGLVVVAVTDERGRLLLVDSEWVDGWTLPNGPVGADEDWAVAADRWAEDELSFPVKVDQPELVIRTETRTEDGSESVVGYTVAFVGIGLFAQGWRQVYRARQDGRLVNDGLYRYVRHPQYTGLFIAMFGEGIIHWPTIFSVGLFPLIVVVFTWLAWREEHDMINTFGEEYRTYQREVPMFLPSRKRWRDLVAESRDSGDDIEHP